MHPRCASSEYTVPFWPPMNRRPLATVGCDQAEVASGNPNAHLSVRRGTCASVMPALGADWNLVFVEDGDQPLHSGAVEGFAIGGVDSQRPTDAPVMSPPSAFPVR